MTQENIDSMGYKLVAGELPRGDKDEIAISLYVAQTFLKAGILSDDGSYTSIDSPDSLVGYEFSFGDVNYRITGIIDTKLVLNVIFHLPKIQNIIRLQIIL